MSKLLKAFLFATFVAFPFAANAVTVASWGGAYTESQIKAYVDTYSVQVQFNLKITTVVLVK